MHRHAIAGLALALLLLAGACGTRRGQELGPDQIIHPPQTVVFTSTRDDAHTEIYVMDAAGNNVQRLTFNSVDDAAPVLSPDGSKITFRRETNPASVFVMNADGTDPTGLAPGLAAEWSPDASKLALVTDSLCVMNADATGKRCFGVGATSASWSPDGTKIAYVANGLGGQAIGEIYTISPTGTGPVRISYDGTQKGSLSWSPDGARLMYTVSQTVYIVNADGSGLVSPCSGRDGRWSPDGQQIIFVTDALDGNEEVYTVRLDGSDLRNLTHDPANDGEPDWGPRQ